MANPTPGQAATNKRPPKRKFRSSVNNWTLSLDITFNLMNCQAGAVAWFKESILKGYPNLGSLAPTRFLEKDLVLIFLG